MNKELLSNPEVREIAEAYMSTIIQIPLTPKVWDDFVKANEPGWKILNWSGANADKIFKVQREDGEVFTVNETVAFTSNFKIRSFRTDENRMYVDGASETGNLYNVPLGALRKIKQVKREHIFFTDDNVKIYEGDEYFFCGEPLIVYSSKTVWHDIDSALQRTINKYFSTREKAEQYVLMNRPCLSIQDMLNNGSIAQGSPQTESLIKLAKTKL